MAEQSAGERRREVERTEAIRAQAVAAGRHADAAHREADAHERQADALERIATVLERLTPTQPGDRK